MRAAVCAGLVVAHGFAGVAAQPIPPASVTDRAIGWMKVYDFKDATAPLTVDHRVYSAAQLTTGAKLANWMQASYVPIGALGDVVRAVSVKLGPYNRNTAALPQSYGVHGKLYTDLRHGANRIIERASNSHLTWDIQANGFYGEPANALSTPTNYYFTLPTFVQQGYSGELEKAVDLSGHPFLGEFPAWFQRNSFNGNRKFVLLSKDRRMPFVKLTKGQYLDAIDVAITRLHDAEKARITQAEQGDPKRIAQWVKPLEEKTARRRAVLAANREKYGARIQEVAEIWTTTPDVLLENYPDVFDGNGGSSMRLPVYTIDRATVERAKGDAPLWIVVSWTADLNDPVNKRLHEAVVKHFNFEYVFNHFFDPEKVAGRPYAPRRP